MAAPNDSIAFSDVTNKNGIIQAIEFWTGMGDGFISGDSTLLAIMTARVNEAFDRIMPLLLSFTDNLRWDDINHTNLPIGTTNLVSGQSDYKLATDASSLNILNITDVQIYPSATSTFYYQLQRITADNPLAPRAMSPLSTDIGTPYVYLERGNTIFLFPQPNYNATSGLKFFFERDPSYFLATDTTKKPGIPRPFHGLLPLYAAYDWILVNKSSETALITRLEAQIKRREGELRALIGERNPTHNIISTAPISFR